MSANGGFMSASKFTTRLNEVVQNLKSMVSAPQIPVGDANSAYAGELKTIASIREEIVNLHETEADLLTKLSEHLATIGALIAQLNEVKEGKSVPETPAETVVEEKVTAEAAPEDKGNA